MTLPFNINLNQFKGFPYLRIDRTLRFTGLTNSYMSRTLTTPTSSTKFTISTWVKRGKLSANSYILAATTTATASTNFCYLYFDATNNLRFENQNAGTNTMLNTSKAVFVDTTAWYHIVFSVDITQATAANRTKLWVNGVSQVWTTQTNTLNTVAHIAVSGDVSYVNATNSGGTLAFSDQNLAEVLFVDGQQLSASDFGITDTATGVWQPIRYNGTYGANGTYLTFQNNATVASLGNDYSGTGNNYTVGAGVVLTGTSYASTIDSPTLYDDGSITYNRGNYCVWNSNWGGGTLTTVISRGGLQASLNSLGSTYLDSCVGTTPLLTGKWYWEVTPTSATSGPVATGICLANVTSQPTVASALCIFSTPNAVGYGSTGLKYVASQTGAAYGSAYTTNIVIGVALDLVNGTITFYRNNVSQGAISISLPAVTGYAYLPCLGVVGIGANNFAANFGQYPFTYTPPTDYLAVNTYNMYTASIPPVINGSLAVAATKYTGTGASLTVNNTTSNPSGTSFQPDLVWVKSTSAISDHKWTDSVRGVTNAIISNTTGAQTTDANGLTSFNQTGFTIGSDATYNTASAAYVGYQWLAGNGSASNSDGSIASTVSRSVKYGFSVVTYTGTGANATVGHGLGVAPSFIIVKQLTAASATNWAVYHGSLANTQYMLLNTTAAVATGATYWNSTSPTSTTFSIGTSADVNTSGGTYVAYCWTPIAGYSAFGSYAGTGVTTPPYIALTLGFRPRIIMVKRTSSIGSWYIIDSVRQAVNQVQNNNLSDLQAQSTAAALNLVDITFTSNGFCPSGTNIQTNGSNYVYVAFAENPFVITRAF